MFLEVRDLAKRYGDRQVVRDLGFSLEKGKLMCILGASGCGKTTTLNMLGGFVSPDAGSIVLGGRDITALPAERRPVTTVFQSYGLFSHMTVMKNVCYGLKFLGLRKAEIADRGMRYLSLVNLQEYADVPVTKLSGGQQQRVALARALAVEPELCLLDEPFSNLDAALRVRMRQELKALQRKLNMTMLFVTHDQEEAITLSDQMAVMEKGRLVECGDPLQILRQPVSPYAAEFLKVEELHWTSDGKLLKEIPLPSA